MMNNYKGAYYEYVERGSVYARPYITYNDEFYPTHEKGYVPSQLYRAYGLFSEYTGRGIRIALIEAFSRPRIIEDTNVFSDAFGLPRANIEIIRQSQNDNGVSFAWQRETTLDVEWAHAAAPDADLTVVFAKDDEIGSLVESVALAVENGADVVSMSFGTPEFAHQSAFSEIFAKENVCFVASSGDTGGQVVFPSVAANVISVGGTTLALSSDGELLCEERAWENSGGGVSRYVKIPDHQAAFSPISEYSGSFRASPDVALFASSEPGVAIYHGIDREDCGWCCAGGTSFGAPFFAGILARAAQRDKSILQNAPAYLYRLAGGTRYILPQYNFNDITLGSSGKYTARVGYDLYTGLGSPASKQIIDKI